MVARQTVRYAMQGKPLGPPSKQWARLNAPSCIAPTLPLACELVTGADRRAPTEAQAWYECPGATPKRDSRSRVWNRCPRDLRRLSVAAEGVLGGEGKGASDDGRAVRAAGVQRLRSKGFADQTNPPSCHNRARAWPSGAPLSDEPSPLRSCTRCTLALRTRADRCEPAASCPSQRQTRTAMYLGPQGQWIRGRVHGFGGSGFLSGLSVCAPICPSTLCQPAVSSRTRRSKCSRAGRMSSGTSSQKRIRATGRDDALHGQGTAPGAPRQRRSRGAAR